MSLNDERPRPAVSPWARPFWAATRAGRLDLQKCKACARWIFYPRIACPHCGADESALEWTTASGRGRIYSFTVVQANAPSAFAPELPYVVAVIRLDEGPQMLSNIVGCDLATLGCDQPVRVVFERLDDEFTLPLFTPIPSPTGAAE